MNTRKLIIILISLLLFVGFAYAQMTTSQIVKKYSPSVVTIVALDQNDQPLSLGSGFFINTEGEITSNHHVFEGSAKAVIKTMDGRKGEVLEIINDDPELDLLIAKTSLKNTNPAPLGDSDTISVGEDIIAIGNPAGLEGTVSNGIVSGVRKVGESKFIQITAPISPGSSGGPVFDSTGKVIGVATAYLDIGQNLNFAMPVNYLKSLKPSSMKLSLLPKMMPKAGAIEKNRTLVEVFDVHYCYPSMNGSLDSVDFGIKNLSNYPVNNIILFFVYKNFREEVINYSAMAIKDTILPQLAKQFSHKYYVRYFSEKEPGRLLYERSGTVEIRILDYQFDRTGGSAPADLLFK